MGVPPMSSLRESAKILDEKAHRLHEGTALLPRITYDSPMIKVSSGLLMYKIVEGTLQVLLVHPGGPFWRNKDDGAWSIPKGEVAEGEDLLNAARREFEEETGVRPTGRFITLKSIQQK